MRIHDAVSGVQSATEMLINAVNMQAADSGCLPRVLSYAPVASMNPFQRLLYCRAKECGYAIVPTPKFQDLGSVNWGKGSVIHLHWLASILRDAIDRTDAQVRIEEFRRNLTKWKKGGHKIVWTMHNVLPHDTKFPDEEIDIRKTIGQYADAVHILSNDSIAKSADLFESPLSNVFHVPHPSYEGWYANVAASTSAKLDLGIRPGEFVILQFGSIQPYKGTPTLISAFHKVERLRPSRKIRLIIAGKPVDKAHLSEINSLANGSENIIVIPSAMDEREVQTLFNASDVVVAPYTTTLNSGVALLAATFKKALVAPKIGGIMETYMEDDTLLYSDIDGDTLLEALLRALDYRMQKSVFSKILERHKPEDISIKFFDAITQKLFGLDN